jgi:hypothetical protein
LTCTLNYSCLISVLKVGFTSIDLHHSSSTPISGGAYCLQQYYVACRGMWNENMSPKPFRGKAKIHHWTSLSHLLNITWFFYVTGFVLCTFVISAVEIATICKDDIK